MMAFAKVASDQLSALTKRENSLKVTEEQNYIL